jgi:hypothetical protein
MNPDAVRRLAVRATEEGVKNCTLNTERQHALKGANPSFAVVEGGDDGRRVGKEKQARVSKDAPGFLLFLRNMNVREGGNVRWSDASAVGR